MNHRASGSWAVAAAIATALTVTSALGDESPQDARAPDVGLHASPEETARNPLGETAAWMSASSDERQRAAGLLYRLSSVGQHAQAFSGGVQADASAMVRELERAIRTTTDGPALAWLALACREADIRKFCVEKGLDDAIVAYDGANFFSRTSLRHQPEVEETRRLLLDSKVRRSYEPERVVVWHEALQRYDWREALESNGVELSDALFSELSFALFAGFSSFSFPGALIEACGPDIDFAADWIDACGEIGAEMAERGRTAAHRFLGHRVLARRAEALGDSSLAATYEGELESLKNRFYCISRALSAVDGRADETLQRDYLRWLENDGEIGALERLADLADLDCSNPAPPWAEALKQAGVDAPEESRGGQRR